jgi:hypothetical protein
MSMYPNLLIQEMIWMDFGKHGKISKFKMETNKLLNSISGSKDPSKLNIKCYHQIYKRFSKKSEKVCFDI